MSKELEDKLGKQADEMGLTGERRESYIKGTMTHLESEKGLSEEEIDEVIESSPKEDKAEVEEKIEEVSSDKGYLTRAELMQILDERDSASKPAVPPPPPKEHKVEESVKEAKPRKRGFWSDMEM